MLHLQAKAPGDQLTTRPVNLEVSYDKVFGRREEAYQRLLEDAMAGRPPALRPGRRPRGAMADRRRGRQGSAARGAVLQGHVGPVGGRSSGRRRGWLARTPRAGGTSNVVISLSRSPGCDALVRHHPVHDVPDDLDRAARNCGRSGSWSGSACSSVHGSRRATSRAHSDMTRDDVYRMATRLVVAGVIGARITWDITHWSEIEITDRSDRGVERRLAVLGRVHRRRAGRDADDPSMDASEPLDEHGRLRLRPHHRSGHRSHRMHLGRRALRQPQLVAPGGALRRRFGPGVDARTEPARDRIRVPQHRDLRVALDARVVRRADVGDQASPGARHDDGDLLPVLRHLPRACPTSCA